MAVSETGSYVGTIIEILAPPTAEEAAQLAALVNLLKGEQS